MKKIILLCSAITILGCDQGLKKSNDQIDPVISKAGVEANDFNQELTQKDCVVEKSQWEVNGLSCSANGFVIPFKSTRIVENSIPGLSGSAAYECSETGLHISNQTCFHEKLEQAPAPQPAPVQVAENQSCSPDAFSFPTRLTVKGDGGAVCGITLSGALGGGNSLPDNNGRGYSYAAQGIATDTVPGVGRVCLVCRDNKVQVSQSPETDCRFYTNNAPQFCQPKTCEVPTNYGWGRCQSNNVKKTLAWGESITLQNTSSRASAGAVTLSCTGEAGLRGQPAESQAACQANSQYSEIESFKLEKTDLGPTKYMNYISFYGYAFLKVCSPYTSMPGNPDCKTIKFDSSILDKSYDANNVYSRAFTVSPQSMKGSEVSFWVNGLMVMVMNPWASVAPGNPESIIVPANTQPHSSTMVRDLSIKVITTAKDPIHIYEAFPRLYFGKRALEQLKPQGLDLSGLVGKELIYDRSFEFKPENVPWN